MLLLDPGRNHLGIRVEVRTIQSAFFNKLLREGMERSGRESVPGRKRQLEWTVGCKKGGSTVRGLTTKGNCVEVGVVQYSPGR